MSTVVDWGKLVAQGRAKAPGIPWTNEEMAAIKNGMSPDDVRAGLLTKEAVANDNQTGEKKLNRMKLAELIEKAKELGLEFDESAVTRNDLILEIEKVQEKTASDQT